MTASSMHHHIRELGRRCGYKDNISGYYFRRGFANGIDDQVSSAKKRQLLGHMDDGTGQSYISNTIAIDTQHAVRGEPQNKAYMDFASSVRYKRDLNRPVSHTARMNASVPIFTDEEIATFGAKHPDMKRRQLLVRMGIMKLQESLEAYDLLDAEAGPRHGSEIRTCIAEPSQSRLLKILLVKDTLRQAVITSFWGGQKLSLGEAVQTLSHLAKPDRYQLFYPGLKLRPIEERCPICRQQSKVDRRRAPALHILLCYQKKLPPSSLHFCFECAKFYQSRNRESHCRRHLSNLVTFCGIIESYGLLVVPGSCPFCLGDTALTCAKRFQSFLSPKEHMAHVQSHIDSGVDWSCQCPHPECHTSMKSQQDFERVWNGSIEPNVLDQLAETLH